MSAVENVPTTSSDEAPSIRTVTVAVAAPESPSSTETASTLRVGFGSLSSIVSVSTPSSVAGTKSPTVGRVRIIVSGASEVVSSVRSISRYSVRAPDGVKVTEAVEYT